MKVLAKVLFFWLMFGSSIGFADASRQISYRGKIETDQEYLVEGNQVNMVFYLVADNRREVSGPADTLWWAAREVEGQRVVIDEQGRFEVMLGEHFAFAENLFVQYPRLYLGIRVKARNDEGVWQWLEVTAPGNRKRFVSSPFAISVSEAKDFNVRGDTQIHGDLEVTGRAVLNQKMTVNGRSESNRDFTVVGSRTDGPETNAAVRFESESGQVMTMDGDEIDTDTPLLIQTTLGGTTVTGGAMQVSGDVNLQGHVENFILSPTTDLSITRNDPNPAAAPQSNLGSSSDRVCFLTSVRVNGSAERDNPYGECQVVVEGAQWILRARQSQAGSVCQAQCLTW